MAMNLARRGLTLAQWRGPAADSLMCKMCVSRAYSLASFGADGASITESAQGEQPTMLRRLLRELPSLFPNTNMQRGGAGAGAAVVTTPYGMLTGADSLVADMQLGSDSAEMEDNAGNAADAQGASAEGAAGGLEALLGETLLKHTKRTFQPSLIRRKRKHGFLKRIRTKDGRRILNARRRKGRSNLCA